MHGKLWLLFRRLNQNYFFDYFLVLILAFTLFSCLGSSPVLSDPDSFYHAKMAQFLAQGQILQEFPWLQATGLKDSFVDHHFLYHWLLAPFVKIADPLVGVKMATVIFATALTLAVYWLFKKFHLKYPLVFIFILLTAQPWLFRVSLVKAVAVFLVLLIFHFYFLTHQKWLGLFVTAWLAVWLYAGWPLILAITIVYLLAYWFLEKIRGEESLRHKVKHLLLRSRPTVPLKALGLTLGGLTAGLVVNPYFPANLNFYWQQTVKIALVNYQQVIAVGGEWYPYQLLSLFSDAGLVCALFVMSVFLFSLTFKKQSIYSLTWAVLAAVFFLLTLKSKRYVEFFIPLTVIFSAFCFSDYLRKLSWLHLKILSSIFWQSFFGIGLLVLGLGFLLQVPQSLHRAKAELSAGWPLNHYQKSAAWLKDFTPKNSVVFQADWDDFPFLFYYNSDNYYLTGLDPTFMYQRDPVKYRQYAEITLGHSRARLKEVLKKDFNSSYVFLDRQHTALERQLKFSGDFLKVYEDEEAKIYQARNEK